MLAFHCVRNVENIKKFFEIIAGASKMVMRRRGDQRRSKIHATRWEKGKPQGPAQGWPPWLSQLTMARVGFPRSRPRGRSLGRSGLFMWEANQVEPEGEWGSKTGKGKKPMLGRRWAGHRAAPPSVWRGPLGNIQRVLLEGCGGEKSIYEVLVVITLRLLLWVLTSCTSRLISSKPEHISIAL